MRGHLASTAWDALGSSVVLRVTDTGALGHARARVERELDAIDRACNRFRADSELSRLNALAGRRVYVSPLLLEAVELALSAAELTDGDVDPSIGRALELAGYDRDWKLLAAAPPESTGAHAEEREAAAGERPPSRRGVIVRVRSDWRGVIVDRPSGSIRVPRGISLDVGATAKAWAADRGAEAAARAGECGALVSLGGDIATSGPAPPGGWRIRVTDDHRSDPHAPGQTISILSGGLATSSTSVRRWRHHGRTMHHIIDPRTRAPVRGSWRTVSVAAASCAEANVATTAAIVRAGAAPRWLAGLGLPARLVDDDGRVVCVGDWPAEAAPRPVEVAT
jgi:thiamine biosynthesis lipoprotein